MTGTSLATSLKSRSCENQGHIVGVLKGELEDVDGNANIHALLVGAANPKLRADGQETSTGRKYIEVADGHFWLRPKGGVACFAGDLSEEEQKIVYATHYAPATDLFSRNAPGVAWKSKPSWYIVANNDRAVHPELQRFVAKRMGASIHALDSSRIPMLSHPDFVINVIRAAAKGVQKQQQRRMLRSGLVSWLVPPHTLISVWFMVRGRIQAAGITSPRQGRDPRSPPPCPVCHGPPSATAVPR
jgi:hypothetical protein